METKDPTLHRLPPQSIEAEESVLSACVLGQTEDAIDKLTPDDFYRTAHHHIFEAIIELHQKQLPTDLVSLTSHLRDKNRLEEVGGVGNLARMVDTIPASVDISYHCKIIKEKSTLRKLIAKCNEITASCYQDQCDPASVLDAAQSSVMSVDFDNGSKTCAKIADVMMDCIDDLEAKTKSPNSVTGIPTGITSLDTMTAGFQNSDLIIIAARPSMGKTALALHVARECGMKNIPASVFSLEMSRVQLAQRMLASHARVNGSRVRVGMISGHEWPRITDAADSISIMPIYIDDIVDVGIMGMRREIRRHVKEYGTKIVFIDYLQLMKTDSRSSRMDLEIGAITRGLKLAAKEFNIPIVCLSQLNRELEKRPDKRPKLSDLRDSGAIEQDADVVVFLYRDEVYNKDENNPNRGTCELVVAKQRSGPVGTVPAVFMQSVMRFENPA